jgi:hypothetical protein
VTWYVATTLPCDVDTARVFRKAEKEYERVTGGARNTKLFSYRFWVYLLMGILFFGLCMVGIGTSRQLC